MDFLGVGPAELIFIMIIMLVVVGPERLPVLARQAGRFLVTVRDWVQKSPDAAMVMRARQELEVELANIRESLAEVQSARDEVVQAAKQVNTLVKDDVIGSTRAAIEEVSQPGTVARATKPNGLPASPSAPETPPEPQFVSADGSTLIEEVSGLDAPPEPQLVSSDGSTLIEGVPADEAAVIAPPRTDAPNDDSAAGISALQSQIAALTEELRQLQAQLQERGVIDPAPLVSAYGAAAPHLVVPDLAARSLTTELPTLEEPADVEQPVYTRD